VGQYINEDEARNAIKSIVSTHTTDFTLFTQKRTTIKTACKEVVFIAIFLYEENNEELYNKFVKNHVQNNDGMKLLKSDTFFENGKKKEAFHIECEVRGV